ncbi:MAG: DNA polymerase III subunit delta [Candidatus Omnitrophica bacterium]|nr:DNA polymerase III subunit delta [Candidatus Omnitrophota bacterium]
MPKVKNIFLLLGDQVLRDEERRKIIGNEEKEIERQAFFRCYGDDLVLNDFLEQARTYPFLSEKQFILINRVESLPKSDVERFSLFLPECPEFTVIIAESAGLDKRSALYHAFQKYGVVKEFVLDQMQEIERTVAKFLANRGKRITPEALAELIERLSGSLALIYQALEQIVLFAGSRAEIVSEDVVTFVKKEAPYGPFELGDALAARDVEKALRVCRFLFEQIGRDIPEIVGIIHWQLRRLWEVKQLLAKGTSERSLAAVLRLPPFVAGRLAVSAKRFSVKELQDACEELFRLDWKSKTGRVDAISALEEFLLRRSGAAQSMKLGVNA